VDVVLCRLRHVPLTIGLEAAMTYRRGAGPVVRSKIRTRRWLSWPEALGLVAAANAGAVLAAATLMRATDPRQFRSFGDAVWWAVSTITTVGYGDVVPVSAAGRIVGGVLMFVGIASFAVLTAIAASIIVVREVDEEERRTRVEERRLEATEQAVLARIEQLQASLLASSAPAHTERIHRGRRGRRRCGRSTGGPTDPRRPTLWRRTERRRRYRRDVDPINGRPMSSNDVRPVCGDAPTEAQRRHGRRTRSANQQLPGGMADGDLRTLVPSRRAIEVCKEPWRRARVDMTP